jgi:predicted amidohydrolase YtcJ
MKHYALALRLATILSLGFLVGCAPSEQVDLIVRNANIYTVNDQFEKAEAFAVKDGRFIAIGAEHEILNKYSAPMVYDAKRAFVYPGLVDAHSHLMGYGIELQRLNLVGTQSFDEVIENIQTYIAENDVEWVLGRGWDQNDWANKSFPHTDTLAQLFPDHYIALKRIDGHAYMVSPNVIALAGISGSEDIPGGKVVTSTDGKPTGILIDAAMERINEVIPAVPAEQKIKGLQRAQEALLAAGLTSVCDAGLSIEDIQLIDSLQPSLLKLRVYAMYAASKEVYNRLSELGVQTDHLNARSVKLYADGALGSRGAYLLEPYADDAANRGLLITPEDSIMSWAKRCYNNDFQLNVHCIGDAANRAVLKTMGKVLQGTNDRRWRIEHAQVVHPEDRALFGAFNILPSMQPTHATSDMTWAKERLGDRLNYAYNLERLKNENGMIPLGTDFPVESIEPIKTFYAAVVRKNENGEPQEGFQMEEALSRQDALKGITIWPALANFDEEKYGSIEVGKLADFVVLNRDLLSCSEEDILSTKVLATWIQGEQLYDGE